MSWQEEDIVLSLHAKDFSWSEAVTEEPALSMAINNKCTIQELVFFVQQDAVNLDEGYVLEVFLDKEYKNKIIDTSKNISEVGLVEQSKLYFKKAIATQVVEKQFDDVYLSQYNSEIVTFKVQINGQEQGEEIEYKLNVPIIDIIEQYAMTGVINGEDSIMVRFVDKNGQVVCTDITAQIVDPPFQVGETYRLFIQQEPVIVQQQEQQQFKQPSQIKNQQIKKEVQDQDLKQQSKLTEAQMSVLRVRQQKSKD